MLPPGRPICILSPASGRAAAAPGSKPGPHVRDARLPDSAIRPPRGRQAGAGYARPAGITTALACVEIDRLLCGRRSLMSCNSPFTRESSEKGISRSPRELEPCCRRATRSPTHRSPRAAPTPLRRGHGVPRLRRREAIPRLRRRDQGQVRAAGGDGDSPHCFRGQERDRPPSFLRGPIPSLPI